MLSSRIFSLIGEVAVSKTLKIILIIISALVVFIVLPIIVTGLFFFGVTKEVVDTFGSAYGDEDIMEYVKKTHGIEVEVTKNKGREPSSFFGMAMNDARVRTVEDDPLEFTVFISIYGKITGDDYEDVRERKKLSDTLQASVGYRQLESLGFLNIHFGADESDPDILMDLPQGLTFADEVTAQIFLMHFQF